MQGLVFAGPVHKKTGNWTELDQLGLDHQLGSFVLKIQRPLKDQLK